MGAFRLLFCTRDAHPSFRADIAHLFGKALPGLGLECSIAALGEAGGDAAWSGGEVFVHPAPSGRSGRTLTLLRHVVRTVRREGRRHHAVQVRNLILGGILARREAVKCGLPFFYWMSFPLPEDDLLRVRTQGLSLGVVRWAWTLMRGLATNWLLYRWLLPRCDHVFVQSDRMLEDVARQGIPRERMTAVPMGVNMAAVDAALGAGESSAAREQADAAESDAPTIVYLGALDRTRRPERMLEMLLAVRRTVPEARLLCIGDAAEAADRHLLEQSIRARGLEHAVCVTGWLPRDAAWRLAATAQVGICFLPRGPVFDSMSPTKAVECMALGLPLVVTDHPDQGAVVRASGGGLVVEADADAEILARAVCRVLSDLGARSMGARGREWVERNRDYGVIAEYVFGKYKDLVEMDQPGATRG